MKLSLKLDRTLRPPPHNPGRKHAHVRKTLKLLEASIAQSIISVNGIKTSCERETLALLYQANIFSDDMQKVLYSLQKVVINTFADGSFDPVLLGGVKQFSQFAYSIQQHFSDDPETLKNQIKENLRNIMPEARHLVESVTGNKNREYLHEIVSVVDDILFAVQKVELRNKFEDDTPDAILGEVINFKYIIINKLNSFEHVNRAVLLDMKNAASASIEKTFRIVRIIDQAADNYSDDIRNVLLQVSVGITRALGDLDSGIRVKSDIMAIKCSLMILICAVVLELENLTELLKITIEDQQVENNLHNLILLCIVNAFAAGEQLIRHIDLAKIQITDE